MKICGVMRPEDALAAAEAGADAVGLIFYPKAKRCIDLATAQEIVRCLPPFVTPVGLFVNAELREIRSIAEALGLTYLQLHGQEAPELVAQLNDYVVLKSVSSERTTVVDQVLQWKSARQRQLRHLKGFVLETPHTGQAGGSGVENDWAMIGEFVRDGLFDGGPALIVAGGLNPDNVGVVVRSLRPWAVDVSSGVEEVFGKKSPAKMRAFVAAVREANEKI